MERDVTTQHEMFGRRKFLRHVAHGAAGLLAHAPLLESLRRVAHAASSPPPRRLVVLFSPNGTLLDEFFDPTPDEAVRLGPVLQPLAPFRDRLLLLDGLSMGVTALGPGNEHQRGMAAWLTGYPNGDGDFCGGDACMSGRSGWATAASLDQRVAQRFAGATALRSLELGVRIEGANNRHRMSYAGPQQPLAPDHDPRSVYRRVFGQSNAALETQLCVSDRLAQEYRGLTAQVSGADRQRLDAHLAAVEDIEHRLRGQASAHACNSGLQSPPALDPTDARAYAAITRLQIDLLVTALRCDRTRVASLMWSGSTAKVVPSWLDRSSDGEGTALIGFHSYTHDPYRDPTDPHQVAVRDKLRTIYRWYASSVAYLLTSLQNTLEPDGSTLLDNTLVLWGSELASPDIHSFDRMPFVVAGGSRYLRNGRYLDLRGEQHTALLATLGSVMGLPDARYGHPDFARAALPGLVRE